MTYEEAIKAIKIKEMKIECKADRYAEFLEGLALAEKALEKQIPKFVLCPKGFQGVRDTRYHCPSCKSLTRQREAICHKCGQAVKYPKEVYLKKENKIILDWSE